MAGKRVIPVLRNIATVNMLIARTPHPALTVKSPGPGMEVPLPWPSGQKSQAIPCAAPTLGQARSGFRVLGLQESNNTIGKGSVGGYDDVV